MTRTGSLLLPLALLASACHDPAATAPAPPVVPPVTPPSLQAPADQQPVLALLGSGHQIYACAADGQGAFAWVLRAPEAELFKPDTKTIGKHYLGPTWESIDGSKVVGLLVAKADAPDPDAIPWLLLSAKSNAGSGVFAHVRSVQRVDTVGGKAPSAGCDADHVGAEARVGYRATYYFYV